MKFYEIGSGFVSQFLVDRWRITWAFYLKLEDWSWPTVNDEDVMMDCFEWVVKVGPFELIRWKNGEL